MDTAHKTEEEKKEYFDTEEVLDQKVTMLAEWVKASKHFVAFTGAGISTSAGIPDFRSGVNTVLPTGPGAWEKLATGGKSNKATIKKAMASATPTPCHMALVKLLEVGYLKFVISQNVDGLHRKSGIPAKNIAEVHGNTNLELCKNKSCQMRYLRDFRVRTAQKVHDHKTGRFCENCGKELYDSIINFGEYLPEKELNDGFYHGAKADLCLALGSSLRVPTAASMAEETANNGGRLVIVNLQATPLDKKAFKINGLIDDVIVRLMKKLELPIPSFTLKRRVAITKSDIDPKKPMEKTRPKLIIRGIDEEGTPYSLLKSVDVTFVDTKENFMKDKEPVKICPIKSNLDKGRVKIQLKFQGHHGEVPYIIEIPLDSLKLNEPVYYLIEFDPQQKQWVNCKQITL